MRLLSDSEQSLILIILYREIWNGVRPDVLREKLRVSAKVPTFESLILLFLPRRAQAPQAFPEFYAVRVSGHQTLPA